MKSREITFTTMQSVDQIKAALQNVIGKAEVSALQSSNRGLLDTGAQPALEVLVEKSGLGGVGSVQVYVFDNGAQRDVKLVALGDGGMSRAFGGAKNTASLGKSMKMAESIAGSLR